MVNPLIGSDLTIIQEASIVPAASVKPVYARRHLPPPHTSQPRLAVAHTQPDARAAQKFAAPLFVEMHAGHARKFVSGRFAN